MSEAKSERSFRPLSKLAGVANAVFRTAANAIALAEDSELRKKASDLVVGQASRQFTTIRQGVVTTADSMQQRIRKGPAQVQQVLLNLQRHLEEERLLMALKVERDAPVDVQIGPQLYEHAPQELRSRLWMALLDNLSLATSVKHSALSRTGSTTPSEHEARSAGHSHRSSGTEHELPGRQDASAGAGSRDGSSMQRAATDPEDHIAGSISAAIIENATAPTDQAHSPAQASSETGGVQTSAEARRSISCPQPSDASIGRLSPEDLQNLSGGGERWQSWSGGVGSHSSRSNRHPSRDADGIEQWDIVQDGCNLFSFEANTALTSRLHPATHAQLSPDDVAIWQKLMVGIMSVPWPISTHTWVQEFPEDCRYNTLLQISIGQEETDDIIARDIYRTFPEHPQFGFEQGQQALFRVLKAYSLHDLEVNYCQGMAFVAGVILMYLPEEPAFRMLMSLMAESRANLRRLFTPGLEGLKAELRKFEWLMQRHFPALAAHLVEHNVVPVLYASQWFLTVFSCPFPSAFACRIIDVILAEGHTEIMLQVALAVTAECEAAVLQLDDFEDIITYLKVEPVKWSAKHQRKVLNAAMASAITPEMIRAADFAVVNGFCGSLSRRTSSRHDLPSAGTPASSTVPSTARAVPRVSASDLSSRLRSPSMTQATAGTAHWRTRNSSSPPAEGEAEATVSPGGDEASLAGQAAEFAELCLAMDTMFPDADGTSLNPNANITSVDNQSTSSMPH